jgi:choline monooxygenase
MDTIQLQIDEDIGKASTPPGRFYADPAAFAALRDAVFARSWQLVGDADQVKVPGKVFPTTLLEG